MSPLFLFLSHRISAADEELVWHFSQPPSEHLFPVPNVSQSVALRVRVQSLPRQPTYPTLACSIHTGLPPLYSKTPNHTHSRPLFRKSQDPHKDPNLPLYSKSPNPISGLPINTLPIHNLPINSIPISSGVPVYSKRSQEPADSHGQSYQNGELPQVNIPHHLGSPRFHRPSPSPTPSRTHSPSHQPPGGKAVRWLYSALNGPFDHTQAEDYESGTNSVESSKTSIPEPLRAFKAFSMAKLPRCPSPRPIAMETNPLIGSLLQERQEVIARIAQRLNFCDPTAPPLPPGLFATDTPPKAMWGGNHNDMTLNKTKETEVPPGEPAGHMQPTPFDTPVSDTSFSKRESTSPKPAACRKLKLTETRGREQERNREGERNKERERDSSLIAQAVQDITRLIQDRLSIPSLSPIHSRSGSPQHHTHTTVTHTVRTYTHTTHTASNGYTNGHEPHQGTRTTATHMPVCKDKPRVEPGTEHLSFQTQNGAPFPLEEPPSFRGQSRRLQTSPQEEPRARTPSPSPSSSSHTSLLENGPRTTQNHNWTHCDASTALSCNLNQNQPQPQTCAQVPQDENQAPPGSASSNPPSPKTTPPSNIMVRDSSLNKTRFRFLNQPGLILTKIYIKENRNYL